MSVHNSAIPTPLRILIIEDSEGGVTAFCRALEKGGLEAEITHFIRAEDALPSLEKVSPPYDLIVADYKLRGMTGLELCKYVIDKELPLPCIMVTGAGTENIVVKALKAGVVDYLVKDSEQNYLEILPLFLLEVVRKYRDRQVALIFRQEKEVIAAIAEMFLAPEDAITLCRKLPETLAQGFAFPVAAVLLLSENQKELVVKGITGVAETLLEKRQPLETSTCAKAIILGVPAFTMDVAANLDLHCLLRDSGIDTCLAVPIKDKSSGVIGVLVLADFSKRSDAEIHISALQEIAYHLGQEFERKQVEEKFRTVANFAADWEYWIGPDEKFIYVSPSVKRITGYSVEEFCEDVGLLLKIIHPDDRDNYVSHKHNRLENNEVELLELRLITKAGNERWISHSCQNVYSEDGKYLGVRGSNRDITALKESEAGKAKLQAMLAGARKMETIATLAGGIAHDFNNALTCVIGNIELMKMDPTSHDVEAYVKAVEKSAYRMAGLTKQLLAYARGGKYLVKEIGVHRFIEKTIHEMGYSINKKYEVVTHLECRDDRILVDSGQLQMVLNSIFTNAVEAIDEQGRVEISCNNLELTEQFISNHPGSEYGSYVCIIVKDNGCGMGKETLARLFEPFYSTKFVGRGLGMAAAYGIVKNHGGYLNVDSKPGNGTSVQVYLPLAVPEVAGITGTAEKTLAKIIDMQ